MAGQLNPLQCGIPRGGGVPPFGVGPTCVYSLQVKVTNRAPQREQSRDPSPSLALLAMAPRHPEVLLNEPCGFCLPRSPYLPTLRTAGQHPGLSSCYLLSLSPSLPVLLSPPGLLQVWEKAEASPSAAAVFQEQVWFGEHLSAATPVL